MKFNPTDLLNIGGIPQIPGATGIAGGENWLKKINEVIAGINELLKQYFQLRQTLPGIAQRQPPEPYQIAAEINQPAGDPGAIKILGAARLFLANLQNQGMGDRPVGQVISQIPETVNQLAAVLDQLIAKTGTSKGIKGD